LKITSLFISKSWEEVPELAAFCAENSIDLTAHSFLKFAAVSFEVNESFDIVFFASPRAVTFFLTQGTIPKTAKIACAGKSTKSILENLGYTVHFTPMESSNVTESAKIFATWCEDKTVLFPVSTISNKSYAQFLAKPQVIECVVYSTEIEEHPIDKVDCYVFTSPSNVRGFFKSNELPETAQIIAWGESTAKEIEHFSLQQIVCLQDVGHEELVAQIIKREQSSTD